MSPLTEQYRKVMYATMTVVAALQVVLFVGIRYLLAHQTYGEAVRFVIDFMHMPSAAIVGVLCMRFYEKRAWRWFNRDIDFGGRWELVDSFYDPAGGTPRKVPTYANGYIFIEQTALDIRISEGKVYEQTTRHLMGTWKSIACAMSPDGSHLHAVIELDITFETSTVLATATLAYDMLEVEERADPHDPKSVPVRLKGKFRHCVDRDTVAWMGETTYTRANPLR